MTLPSGRSTSARSLADRTAAGADVARIDGAGPVGRLAERYHDRFACVDGTWRFAERRFLIDLIGDMSAHQEAGVVAATAPRATDATRADDPSPR